MTVLCCSLQWFSSIDGIKAGKNHASKIFFFL